MNRRARLTAALETTRAWHAALPATAAFCDWPDDLVWADRPAVQGEAGSQVILAPGSTNEAARPMLAALQSIAQDVEWRLTYTATEVGQHFLDHFGWFELAGPEGHFTSSQARITVGYWGAGLEYPRHNHAAEELYTVVSGEARFMADGQPDLTLRAGDTRYHASDQPHAMITDASPILTLVLWRGAGLADPPRIST
jgi:mannose-6-phosphate isomerase-like protein (cupin superfamily)